MYWRRPSADLEFADGRFAVKGTDRSLGIFEVAAEALQRNDLPDELRGAARRESDETVNLAAFPMAAMSARSRSIPIPASSKSCATRRSTMSGARSIR